MSWRIAWPQPLTIALLLGGGAVFGCTNERVLGDSCATDADCGDVHPEAICYEFGAVAFCTIACDIEERVCTRLDGSTCVESEIRYRPDAFAPGRCEALGGVCEMRGERTVCIR